MFPEKKITSEHHFPLLADDLFCDLKPQSLASLAKIKERKRFEKGASLFCRGDRARRVYILREGKAQLLGADEFGNLRIARSIEPGEILGLTEALLNLPYETGAEAVTGCVCALIDREDFVSFLKSEPALCLRLVQLLGANLYKSRQQFFSSIDEISVTNITDSVDVED